MCYLVILTKLSTCAHHKFAAFRTIRNVSYRLVILHCAHWCNKSAPLKWPSPQMPCLTSGENTRSRVLLTSLHAVRLTNFASKSIFLQVQHCGVPQQLQPTSGSFGGPAPTCLSLAELKLFTVKACAHVPLAADTLSSLKHGCLV